MPKIKRPRVQSTDQVRKVFAAGAGTPLGVAGTEVFTAQATGGGLQFGAGYDMLCGMIEADQAFTLTIAQGATAANQDIQHVFASYVDPVSGLNVLLVRWIIGGEYLTLTITNTGGALMTVYERSLYLMPHGSHIAGFYPEFPPYVQGADAVGAAPTNNPFGWAGIDAGGLLERGGVALNGQAYPGSGMPVFMNDPAGNALALPGDAGANYDYLMARLVDGTNRLDLAVEDAAAPTTGIMASQIYRAVKQALEDGDAGMLQCDAYGNLEIAGYSRPLGALQMVDIAPIAYDLLTVQMRASAALPAAGAYDAAPVEVPTGGRRYLANFYTYTRGAVGGSTRTRVRVAATYAAVDRWVQPTMIRSGAFAPGATTNSDWQREDHLYQEEGTGAAEGFFTIWDLGRAHKVLTAGQEVGVVGTPGTLEVIGILFNT